MYLRLILCKFVWPFLFLVFFLRGMKVHRLGGFEVGPASP